MKRAFVGVVTLAMLGLMALPAQAVPPQQWDLTSGPVVVSYTVDLSAAPDIAVTGDWGQMSLVGLFSGGSGGAGARMAGFQYDWDKLTSVAEPTLDNDDKFNMQRFPNPGGYGEAMYDIANCATGVVGPAIGSGSNHGIWFDRDGVDQYQAAMFGMVDGDTYNTGGIYDVVLTFNQAATPGYGFVCATVNGTPTGFYTSWVPTGPQISPAGLSFAATEAQMRTMELVTSAGDEGIVISNVSVDGVANYTREGDCPTGAVFVNSAGGSETLGGLVAGHTYTITATGTYFAGGTSQFDIQADAKYSQDAIQRAAGATWTDSVNGYGSYGPTLLDLMIDGQTVDWGAYSATHTYTFDKVATDGTLSFAFNIYDVYYPNNTGGLCVSLTDLGNIGTVTGFFAPVNNLPTDNVAKAGQTIPLKFRVLDWNGNPVSDLTGVDVEVTSAKGINGEGINDVLEAYASGTSGLQDLGDGYYQFNWKTEKVWAATGRTVTLTIRGVAELEAEFVFK